MAHYLFQCSYTAEAWASLVQNPRNRLDRAIGGDPQDPPASGPVGAATTFSPDQAVSSQAGTLYGFFLSPAVPRNSGLHGFGFLGRCPGLERLKS